jgi:hypothetical protein
VRLPHDEALVLYGFLMWYTNHCCVEVEHYAERLVLDKVCLSLCHKLISEIDPPGYEERLEAARERVHTAWLDSIKPVAGGEGTKT